MGMQETVTSFRIKSKRSVHYVRAETGVFIFSKIDCNESVTYAWKQIKNVWDSGAVEI